MMDSIQAFVTLAAAQSPAVKSSSVARSGSAAEDTDFAEVLMQSTEQVNVRADMAAALDVSAGGLRRTPESEEETEINRTGAADGVDLMTLIAQVNMENAPALLPVGHELQAESSGITPETVAGSRIDAVAAPFRPVQENTLKGVTNDVVIATTAAAVAPAVNQTTNEPGAPVDVRDAISFGGFNRGAAKAFTTSVPAGSMGGPDSAADEQPASPTVISTLQVPGTDSSAARVRAPISAAREGLYDDRGANKAGATGVPATQQIKPTESRAGSTEQNVETLRLPASLQMEPAQTANSMASVTTHASGTHNLMPAGQTAISLVPTPIQSPAWSKDFGQHVIRLAVDGQPAAEIHLNPPDLGPIRVSIEIKGQEAMLQFVAERLQTREALESALPRLREMFAAGSLTLADANVTGGTSTSHGSSGQEQRFDQSTSPVHRARLMAVEDALPAAIPVPRTLAQRSGIDLFA